MTKFISDFYRIHEILSKKIWQYLLKYKRHETEKLQLSHPDESNI